jgi:hypothetical protein
MCGLRQKTKITASGTLGSDKRDERMSLFKDLHRLVVAVEAILLAFSQHDKDIVKLLKVLIEQGKKQKKP